jgi:hypothetical protein
MTSLALRVVLVVVVVTPLIAASAAAQTARATIRGVVLDQTGARLPAVQIVVTRDETNEAREATSDSEGRFAVAELAAGRYSIEARKAGFSVYRNRAHLTVGQELWLEPQLAVAATAAVTTGGGDSRIPLLEKNSPAMTTLIDAEQVSNLPLDGRNFLELALLSPGTATAPQGSASSVRGDFAFVTNGAREDFNNYILDGVYNVDPKLNTPAVRPPVDGIQEFEVATSTYDASFGRNAGGQVNVISRSGSNRFTGTAYEFLRNGALDSRNHFAPEDTEDPEYSRHQFGGSIGGPLARNRAFFFVDYEHTRLREGITRVTNVPTLQERSGDFSQTLFAKPNNPSTGQPLPGAQIPSLVQHPTGASLARLYPEPNRNVPFANFVSSPTLEDDVHQLDGKVENNLGARGRLSARYSFANRDLLEPFAGTGFSVLPGFGNLVDRRGQNLGVTFTTSSQRYVNDVRFGYNRVSISVFPETPEINNGSIGLASLATNPRDLGLSLISIAGYSPLGHEYNNPQESTSDTFQLSDTATVSLGSHLMKLGGEWYGLRQSAFRDVQARGFLTFISQGFTGNALADVLFGLPALTGGSRLDNPQNLRAHSWSLFAHDDWRAARKLTVSAGLRYDYIAPPVDKDDRANLYDFASGNVVPVGTGNMPRGGFEPDRNNISPRVGFAWTLDDASQWVVRGGYGTYYNQGALATSEGLFFNPPYFNLGIAFSGPGLPLLTLSNPFPSDFPVFIPQSATAYQRDLQTPWMEHWNVNIQRQIGLGRAIEIAYVGSRGHDLISARDGNQPAPFPNPVNLRPNPLFADITLIESRASSLYNAAQFKFVQRLDHGLSMIGAYTYGKSTDNASGFFTSTGDANFPQNSLDPDAEESRSSFDVRHRFSIGLTYDLPFSGNAWVDGWQVHAVGTSNSGRPFTVAVHPDIDVSNTGRANLGFGFNDRPNVSGDPSLSGGDRTEERWFNTSAFSMPAFGTFGNAGRNSVEGPGFKNLNLAVVKLLPVGGASLQLRFETFNLFNTTNFDLPDGFLGSPTFGQILSAGSPRRIQLGVRAVF